ncbi:acyl-coenzyme A synthetases/AMP-acid ligase [Gaertneriomyces semiglobifer]|nr:acyl-coenzyme A synthetases/AMP-acid ligase [Gaertneriomyces semiglobifer]
MTAHQNLESVATPLRAKRQGWQSEERELAHHQKALHRGSLENPVAFWADAAEELHWHRKCDKVYEYNEAKYPAPGYRWFPNGQINTCFNAVDRHVLAGHDNRTAIIYDSPVTGQKKRISYGELLEQVSTFAAVLARYGVTKGDTVVIYMPMVPESAVAMLSCARLGAIHSVVFGGFAPKELAKRIEDCKPKVVLSATCGIEPGKIIKYKPFLDAAIGMCKHKPAVKIILQRPQVPEALDANYGEHDWNAEFTQARARGERADCAVLSAADPLYLLYTSGSTGVPKGVIRDNGGHAVALNWSMKYIVGLNPGDVFFSASDVGWVVGHSFIVYGPLIRGCTTLIYEGKPVGTPDAGAFWRIIEEYGVKSLFTAPTAIRAIKRDDSKGELIKRYNIKTLKNLFLVGERSDPDTVATFQKLLGIPIRDNWWQTETGFPMTVACEMQHTSESSATKIGSAGPPIPGYDIRVLVPAGGVVREDDEENQQYVEAAPRQLGTLAVKLPLPPGTFPTLWNNHEGYLKSYFKHFPGYYDTSDAGLIDEDGYVSIMSRTDDIINTAGHRLSTGAMEEIVSNHPHVAESAVIGVPDQLKGEVPLGFIVMKKGVSTPADQIIAELSKAIREQIGAIALFKKAFIVDQLPKTRSGKVLRRTLRAIAAGRPYEVPATIEDESVLKHFEALFVDSKVKAKL